MVFAVDAEVADGPGAGQEAGEKKREEDTLVQDSFLKNLRLE
jgi:hypothetical protein